MMLPNLIDVKKTVLQINFSSRNLLICPACFCVNQWYFWSSLLQGLLPCAMDFMNLWMVHSLCRKSILIQVRCNSLDKSIFDNRGVDSIRLNILCCVSSVLLYTCFCRAHCTLHIQITQLYPQIILAHQHNNQYLDYYFKHIVETTSIQN